MSTSKKELEKILGTSLIFSDISTYNEIKRRYLSKKKSFFFSAKQGSLPLVKYYEKLFPVKIQDYEYAAVEAASGNHLKVIEYLEDKSFKLAVTDIFEKTFMKVLDVNLIIVDYTFEKIPINDNYNNRLMCNAALHGKFELVKYLENKSYFNDYIQIVEKAAEGGYLKIIKYFMSKVFNYSDCPNWSFNFVMTSASKGGHLDIVKYAELNNANAYNKSLFNAAKNGHLLLVEYLRKEGANNFKTAHKIASERGHYHVEKYLKEYLQDEGSHILPAD